MSCEDDNDLREANLPKWAQAKLNLLRMRLRESRDRLHESLKPVERPGAKELPFGLYIDGEATRIGEALSVPGHNVVASNGEIEVSMRPTARGIYITARDSCAIYPVASNCFFVKDGRP